jgi:hypothetical protein
MSGLSGYLWWAGPGVKSSRWPLSPMTELSWDSQILSQDARMPGGNPQQGQCRPFRMPATLFPVAQRVNTDSQCRRELLLGQSNELSKGNDIIPTGDAPPENPLALFARNRPREVLVGQLTNFIGHIYPSHTSRSAVARLQSSAESQTHLASASLIPCV